VHHHVAIIEQEGQPALRAPLVVARAHSLRAQGGAGSLPRWLSACGGRAARCTPGKKSATLDSPLQVEHRQVDRLLLQRRVSGGTDDGLPRTVWPITPPDGRDGVRAGTPPPRSGIRNARLRPSRGAGGAGPTRRWARDAACKRSGAAPSDDSPGAGSEAGQAELPQHLDRGRARPGSKSMPFRGITTRAGEGDDALGVPPVQQIEEGLEPMIQVQAPAVLAARSGCPPCRRARSGATLDVGDLESAGARRHRERSHLVAVGRAGQLGEGLVGRLGRPARAGAGRAGGSRRPRRPRAGGPKWIGCETIHRNTPNARALDGYSRICPSPQHHELGRGQLPPHRPGPRACTRGGGDAHLGAHPETGCRRRDASDALTSTAGRVHLLG